MSTAAAPAPARVACPTTVDAGRGALAAALADVPPGVVAVLYDPAVERLLDVLARPHRHHRVVARPVERSATLEDVAAAAAWLAATAPAAVVAIGGGRVLDLAKLASTLGDAPGPLRHLEALTRRAGYARLPLALRRRVGLIAVPTTLGTGSEVSAVAVVDGPGDRTLVFSPHLRPATAILDPEATAGLPTRLVREGALEALMRVAGTEIGAASSLRMATAEARGLARQLAGALDECSELDVPGDELRLYVAQLSGASHRSWALAGRSAFPSPVWFLATELSLVLGVTKVTATAMLLPAWLERVAEGDERWGDRERLAAVWSALGEAPAGAVVAVATRRLLERWQLTPPAVDAAPALAAVAAERAVRRWGGRLPMLGRFAAAELETLMAEAIAERPVAVGA